MAASTHQAAVERYAFTVSEASQASTLGRSKLLELVYDGTIRSKLVGRRRLIIADSLREFIEGGTSTTAVSDAQ